MKLQDLTLQQLKEIVEGAPELTVLVAYNKVNSPYFYDSYFKFWTGSQWIGSGFNHRNISKGFKYLIKLSDIRAELLARQFKVGDKVVFTDIACFPSDLLSVTQMTEFEIYLSNGMSVGHDLKWLRHATPEEIATGHRIDEPSSSCGMSGAEIDQFGEDLRSKPYVDFYEFEQPDTITTQLDPAKCRVVDPALAYDSPGDCPKDDFDAMSEKHRSPSCKCHELPIDAELKPDVVNHPCKAAKKIKKLKKRIAQLEKERQFSELKAKDWAHKYWDSIRDNAGLYSALEEVFAERATEYEAEIERLKGERGE